MNDDVRIRAYRGEADLAGMAAVRTAATVANGGPEAWSAASLANELANTERVDPRRDYLVAEVADRIVATSEIGWADTTAGVRHYHSVGYVEPAWRRRGLGSELMARNEARLREIARAHGRDGPAMLTTWCYEGDAGGRILAEAHGYEPARTYRSMVRPDLDDITVPPLPDGIEVRPLTEDLHRPLWDAMAEAFRDHDGGHDVDDAAFRRHFGDPDFDPDLAIVAFDGDAVAAGVLGFIDPAANELHGQARGWTDPIFTRRPWRRRGLAGALLARALVALREKGMTSAQLEVDAENPNRAFSLYERHGFVATVTATEWRRPLDV